MRMFLVGMCDIFLILYLTTLNQSNPFHNSYLTVDDYNKLREARIQAEHDSEISNAQILELKEKISSLDKEKEQALRLVLTAKAEAEKAMQLVDIEKEKAVQTEIELSKTISKKEELQLLKLLQRSQEDVQDALKIAKEAQMEFAKARESELRALKVVAEAQIEAEKAKESEEHALLTVKEAQIEAEKARKSEQSALKTADALRLEAEQSRKNELNALLIVKEIQVKVEKAEESEQDALKTAEELRLKAEEARKNEEEMRRIAEEARQKAEEALRNEEIARRVAEEERLKAEKAMESEAIAHKLAEDAENQRNIALENEEIARKAEANALKVANVAKSETAKVKSKIKSITQTSDKAYSENILDKLTRFTITIGYEYRLKHVSSKVITMQSLPVKMGDDHVIFVPLDWIGLDSSLTPGHYISYNINANSKSVRKLYIKHGEAEIAALVISGDSKHCLPAGKTNDFSSYMPVLFSIRSQKQLGLIDRIRGISRDFYIFKRDHLLMITRDEFYFDNEGFRGTGDYAEYIVKGDQIVDLEGNFIGFAYKKNKILRIDNLKEWHEFTINGDPVQKISRYIRDE